MMQNASRSLLVFVITILSLACRTVSMAAGWLGSISWAMEDTVRLLQALAATHPVRGTQAARKASTVDISSATHAEITRLHQVIAVLESQLLATKVVPDNKLGDVASRDEILKIRREMSNTVSGLQREVTSLKESLKALELEKKRVKGEFLFNSTRINKKVAEEKDYWSFVERENKGLLLREEHILRQMDGLRSQLGAKEQEVLDIQKTHRLLEGEKQIRDMKLEQLEMEKKEKDREIKMLQKEVKEKDLHLREQREAEGNDLWLQISQRISDVPAE